MTLKSLVSRIAAKSRRLFSRPPKPSRRAKKKALTNSQLDAVFVHIPKTAGTSIRSFLKEYRGKNALAIVSNNGPSHRRLKHIDDILTPEVKVIHGHSTYRDFKFLKQDGVHFLTWVRNPITRCISSHYYMLYMQCRNGHISLEEAQSRTIENFLKTPKACNVMTRYLKGSSFDDFSFIGVIENMEADMRRLGELLGMPPKQEVAHNNDISEFKKSLSPLSDSQVELVVEKNRKDIALYNSIIARRGLAHLKVV